MPDEVARIGALSNGSNGQRSLESASLHFEAFWQRERRNAERGPTAEILSVAKDLFYVIACVKQGEAELEPTREILSDPETGIH